MGYKRPLLMKISVPARFLCMSALCAVLVPWTARAEAERSRFNAGGYFRVMTRPDLQGGNGQLGYWNLYGRLLNETSYAELNLQLDALRSMPGKTEPWASVYARIQGGTFAHPDPFGGNPSGLRLGQLYVRAGNVLLDNVTWQIGTIETYFNDLGLYDFRPASIMDQMLGVSARYELERFELLVGAGDSGLALRGNEYSTVLTAGASARVRIIPGRLELGIGGHALYEPEVKGNRYAPYYTPGIDYDDFVRERIAEDFLTENPGRENFFTRPEATDNLSWKAVGYLGFGGFGPIRWNNFFINVLRRHPDTYIVENYQGRDYQIFVSELTDDRYEVNVGNEMQFTIIPGRLDAAWGVVYGRHTNLDNAIKAGEDNREIYSTVLRTQYYVTPTVHFLLENAVAREVSLNGNLFREHVDSMFQSAGGLPDARGLEFGDSNQRITWQMKTGIVLNPTGLGIYMRPSLRFLYGLQYSSQQAAWGNGFVDDLDQYNVFAGDERHWHHVVAVEAEGWF